MTTIYGVTQVVFTLGERKGGLLGSRLDIL